MEIESRLTQLANQVGETEYHQEKNDCAYNAEYDDVVEVLEEPSLLQIVPIWPRCDSRSWQG